MIITIYMYRVICNCALEAADAEVVPPNKSNCLIDCLYVVVHSCSL